MSSAHSHKAHDIASLDGIRTVAVFIVLVAHSGLERVVPGGLGVTVFFFLSGYLITTLLLDEQQQHGRIAIGKFYARRFLRLSPPLVVALVLAYGLVLAGWHPGGAAVEGFAAQLLYFANYYSIFFDTSATVPKGTGVLWSLAVEEHFYIVYPLLLSIMLRRLSRAQVALVLGLACVGVLGWRCWLNLVSLAPAERTYYATDTRIDSIIFGCLLAMIKNPAKEARPASARPARAQMALLAASIGLLLLTLLYRNPSFRETLRYTLQGIALLPIFYFAIRHAAWAPFAFLGWPWMRRLGVYSYSIYLIHHVVMYSLKFNVPTYDNVAFALVVATGLSVLYATLLDRFVEPYFRRLRARFR